MEYALKTTDYVISNGKGVKPAWDKFANEIDAAFKELKGSELSEAQKFLLSDPPRKQVLKNQKVQFKDQKIDSNQKTTQQLLLYGTHS